MNLNLFPFIVLWVVLAATVIGLIVYRKKVAAAEDDTLHVTDGAAGMVQRQAVVAHKLESIDRWGKTLTVLALVYGLLVGGLAVYQNWVQASNYLGH